MKKIYKGIITLFIAMASLFIINGRFVNAEACADINFVNGDKRMVTNQNSGWVDQGFHCESALSVEVKVTSVSVNGGDNVNFEDQVAFRNYMTNNIISTPGYYKIIYNLSYFKDGFTYEESKTRLIRVLHSGLDSYNNNISDSTLIWASDIVNDNGETITSVLKDSVVAQDSGSNTYNSIIVVGNKGNYGYIAKLDKYGNVVWSSPKFGATEGNNYFFGFATNEDTYLTTINSISYDPNSNNRYVIVGGYKATIDSEMMPFVTRFYDSGSFAVIESEGSEFDLLNEYNTLTSSAYTSGDLNAVIFQKIEGQEIVHVAGYVEESNLKDAFVAKLKYSMGSFKFTFVGVDSQDYTGNKKKLQGVTYFDIDGNERTGNTVTASHFVFQAVESGNGEYNVVGTDDRGFNKYQNVGTGGDYSLVNIETEHGQKMDENKDYYLFDGGVYLIDENSFVSASDYYISAKVTKGSKNEELFSMVKISNTQFAVGGYTASNDLDFSNKGAKNNGTAGLVAIIDDSWFKYVDTKFQMYGLYYDSHGVNGYETIIRNMIYDGSDENNKMFVAVGSTTYDNGSNFVNVGNKDAIIVFVRFDAQLSVYKEYHFGTVGNDILYSVGKNKDKYIASGNMGSNGYMLEFDTQAILANRTIARDKTDITETNIVYDVYVQTIDQDGGTLNYSSSYIALGTMANRTGIEGITIANESGQNFMVILYEMGSFNGYRDLSIEINFGYVENIPTREEGINELKANHSIFLLYDGVYQELPQASLDAIDFSSLDPGTYFFAYPFNNKRDIYYYISRTFNIIDIKPTPEITNIDNLGISKTYLYKRPGTVIYGSGYSGRDYSDFMYDYDKAYYYTKNENGIDVLYTNLDVTGTTINDKLYYKVLERGIPALNNAGEYIEITNVSRVFQVVFGEYQPGMDVSACYERDFFGDYIKSNCFTEEDLEEDPTLVRYYQVDEKTVLNGSIETVIMYRPLNTEGIYHHVYIRKNTYERLEDGLERSLYSNYTLYTYNNEGVFVEDTSTAALTKNNYIEYASHESGGLGQRITEAYTVAFQTLEKAKRYALAQELLRVKYYPNTTGLNLSYNASPNTIIYYYQGNQQARIGNGSFYVYYIDFGNPSYSNRSLCGNGNTHEGTQRVSCANYWGYAFKTLAEVETVARKIVEGKFVQYSYNASPKPNYGNFIWRSNTNFVKTSSLIEPYNKFYQEELETFGYYKSKEIVIQDERFLRVWVGKTLYEINEFINLNPGSPLPHHEEEFSTVTFGAEGKYKAEGYYTVQYCYVPNNCGEMKTFVLDYSSPVIQYAPLNNQNPDQYKDFIDFEDFESAIQNIATKIKIVNVDDVDNYTYFRLNNERYLTSCNEYSLECQQNDLANIYKEFTCTEQEYYEMLFYDRAGNVTKIRFRIGKDRPLIDITDSTFEGFTATINLVDKNQAASIGVYFVPYGTPRTGNEMYLSEITSLYTNFAEEYYLALAEYEQAIKDGEENVEPVSEEMLSIQFVLNEKIGETNITAAKGLYIFKVMDAFGNVFDKEIGLGMAKAELDFYKEDEENGEESHITRYYVAVEDNQDKEQGTIYYLKDINGNFYVDTSSNNKTENNYVVSATPTGEHDQINLSHADVLNVDNIYLPTDLSNTTYGQIDYYVSKEDIFVRFISDDDIYLSVETGNVDDFGFFYAETTYSCLFKIVGKNYEAEYNECDDNWTFVFINGYNKSPLELDEIRNSYGINDHNHYLISGNGNIEGLGAEAVIGDAKLDIENKLNLLGIELVLVNYEDTSQTEGESYIEQAYFFYLRLYEERSYRVNVGTLDTTLVPVEKVLTIDKTVPNVEQEYITPIYVAVEQDKPRIENRMYYYLSASGTYLIDDDYYINADNYVKKYTFAGTGEKESGKTYYIKLAEDIYVLDEEVSNYLTDRHHLLTYEKACGEGTEIVCGTVLKNENIVYYTTSDGGLTYDIEDPDKMNTKANQYIQSRELKDDLKFNWYKEANKAILININGTSYQNEEAMTSNFYLTITEQGNHIITFSDLAGNMVSFEQSIDKSKPVITITDVIGERNVILIDNSTSEYSKHHALTVKVVEENIKTLEYSFKTLAGGTKIEESGTVAVDKSICVNGVCDFEINFPNLNNDYTGNVEVKVYALDEAGNEKEVKVTLLFDNIPPYIYYDEEYTPSVKFGNNLTDTEVENLITIQSSNTSSFVCGVSNSPIVSNIICEDLPNNSQVTINAYEASRKVAAESYVKIGNYYVEPDSDVFDPTKNYYKFKEDNSPDSSKYISSINYIKETYDGDKIRYLKASPVGALKSVGVDYYIIEQTDGEYLYAKTQNNYTFEASEYTGPVAYYKATKTSGGIVTRFERVLDANASVYCGANTCYKKTTVDNGIAMYNENGIKTDINYYYEIMINSNNTYQEAYIIDTRVYQKSNTPFDFNRISLRGRPIIFVATDTVGNTTNYYLNDVVRIIDAVSPTATLNVPSGQPKSYIHAEDGMTVIGIVTNGGVTLTFSEFINKYYCVSYEETDEGLVESLCVGNPTFVNAPLQDIGTNKKPNVEYYYYNSNYENEEDMYKVDNGNIILPVHYVYDNGNYVLVSIELVGTNKEENVNYYVFTPSNKVLYKKNTETGVYTYTELPSYETCENEGGCYTLTYEAATLIEPEVNYYKLVSSHLEVVSDATTYCESNDCYKVVSETQEQLTEGSSYQVIDGQKGLMAIDNGTKILATHLVKENYKLYDYDEYKLEFEFTYDGQKYKKYAVRGEDFSGNISIVYEIHIDKVAPIVANIGSNNKGERGVVSIEAYSNGEYDDTDYTNARNVSDNLESIIIPNGFDKRASLIVEYKKYKGDANFFNLTSLVEGSGKDYHTYWSEGDITNWEVVVPNENGGFTNKENIGIYVVLYRAVDRAGNISAYNRQATRIVFIHDTKDPLITLNKYEVVNEGTVQDPVYVINILEDFVCVSGMCEVSLLVSSENIEAYELTIDFDQNGTNEYGEIIYNNVATPINEKKTKYNGTVYHNEIIDDKDPAINGAYKVRVTDAGSYVNKGRYVGSSKPNIPEFASDTFAYVVVLCKVGHPSYDDESICATVEGMVGKVYQGNTFGMEKDYTLYDYVVYVDTYINGVREERKTYVDDGTIILPGYYTFGATYNPVSIELIGKAKVKGVKYYFNIDGAYKEDIGNNYVLVRNVSEFNFVIDNSRPKISFDKAQDSQKPFYMVVSVDDLTSNLFYKRNNGQLIEVSPQDDDTTNIKIVTYENSWDVYFYQDGNYSVYAKDTAGNISCYGECTIDQIGATLFKIDNTAPMANYTYVANNKTGINFWYAVPKETFAFGTMLEDVYKKAPNYDPSAKYYSLSLNNFNSDGYYAFESYYDALTYLINIYATTFGEGEYTPAKEVYSQGASTGQGKTWVTVSNFNELINEMKHWIFPVFGEELNFGDNSVHHTRYNSDTNYLHEYVTCKIAACVGKKINVIMQKERTITLTIASDEVTTISYYRLNEKNATPIAVSTANPTATLASLSDGIYIFREADKATKFDGVTPYVNEVWYAYIIKNTVDNTHQTSVLFVEEENVFVEDSIEAPKEEQHILPEHYTIQYIPATKISDNYVEGLYMLVVENANISYIPYNKELVSRNHYIKAFIKVDDGIVVDPTKTYYKPTYKVDNRPGYTTITNNNYILANEIYEEVEDGLTKEEGVTYYLFNGYIIDQYVYSRETTYNHYLLSDTAYKVDPSLEGTTKSLNHKYYFMNGDVLVEDNKKWINNFFYSAMTKKVPATSVGKLKETGVDYYYLSGFTGSTPNYIIDGTDGNYIASTVLWYDSDGNGDCETQVTQENHEDMMRKPGYKYCIRKTQETVSARYQHGVNQNLIVVRKNKQAYLELPTTLVDRFLVDNSTGKIEISSYLRIQIRTADSIDFTDNNRINYGPSYYVLASSLFEIENNKVVAKRYLLDLEKYYQITISDRVGNAIVYEVSLSDVLPTINVYDMAYGYQKQIRITNSNLTKSTIVYMDVATEKDDEGNWIYSPDLTSVQGIVSTLNAYYVNGVRSALLRGITLKGHYRIRVTDDHGNISGLMPFSFNPATIDGDIIVSMTSVDYNNTSSLTNKDVYVRWNNIENYVQIYRNGTLYCQTEDKTSGNYCGNYDMSFESNDTYIDSGVYKVDDRDTYPYNLFTSDNYEACTEGEEGCVDNYRKVNDGELKAKDDPLTPEDESKIYYIRDFRPSQSKYVNSDTDYVIQQTYRQLSDLITWNEALLNNEYYVYIDGIGFIEFDKNNSQHLSAPKYILVEEYVKPNNEQYVDLFRIARVKVSAEGTFTVKVCNRFDTGKCVQRLYLSNENILHYKNDTGEYILAEHYTYSESTQEYIAVDLETEVGKLKEEGVTYYFGIENNGVIVGYFEDNGNYISKYHYKYENQQYVPVSDNAIGSPKDSGTVYYVRESIVSFEIDKTAPSGYEDEMYVIYDGNTNLSPKYAVPFSLDASPAYLDNKIKNADGTTVVGVINKNLRVRWLKTLDVKKLNYTCVYVGTSNECPNTSVLHFNSYTDDEDNKEYYYYDFLFKAYEYETRYTFWLEDIAGNAGEKFTFTVSPRKQVAKIYYLDENNNKIYLNNVAATNIKNLYLEFSEYVQVENGLPYVDSKIYYTYNELTGYVALCNYGNNACPTFPTGKTGYGNEGQLTSPSYVRNTITYTMSPVNGGIYSSGTYASYIANMESIYSLANFTVTQILQFTINDGLTGLTSVYSIEIDIVPPAITITSPVTSGIAGVAGGKLYNGEVVITVDEDSTGYLYKNCQLGPNDNLVCDGNETPETFTGTKVLTKTGMYRYHSIDEAGNDTVTRDGGYFEFQIDNDLPTVSIKANNKDLGEIKLAQGAYTNDGSVVIRVADNILPSGLKIQYRLKTTKADFTSWTTQALDTITLKDEGYYEIRAVDFVGNSSLVKSFVIDRTASTLQFKVNDSTGGEESRNMYNGEVIVSDKKSIQIDWEERTSKNPDAPIVKVTVNGLVYHKGVTITQSGEYNIVATDLAGNISTYRIAVDLNQSLCLNNQRLKVKNQYMFNASNITFSGKRGYKFTPNDIIIFAIPLYDGGVIDSCGAGISSYMVLDEKSFIEVKNQAEYLNNSDNASYTLDKNYLDIAAQNGGYVYAFVVEKTVAEIDLALPVSKFFFLEDPIGWTIIFALAVALIASLVKVFLVRRKVKVL